MANRAVVLATYSAFAATTSSWLRIIATGSASLYAQSSFALICSTASMMSSKAPTTSAFQPSPTTPKLLRGVFVGSGSDGMSDPRIVNSILELTEESKPFNDINVLYIGTATYDLPMFQKRQTKCFVDRGCKLDYLEVALDDNDNVNDQEFIMNNAKTQIDQADIIVVGGGNTLFAIDRWTHLGLIEPIRQAMNRGAILTGGSAGAICWFDGGHSDSMDPDTYKQHMLKKHGSDISNNGSSEVEESSTLKDDDIVKEWKYIRVHGLGFLPGLVCPHHDRIQSNGLLRADDFDQMLLEHPGELGIGIDHWAALVVNDDDYRVISLEGKSGSVHPNGIDFCNPNGKNDNEDVCGVPGIWIKQVSQGGKTVDSKVCPKEGKIKDLLRIASEIVEDKEDIKRCREENPSGLKIP